MRIILNLKEPRTPMSFHQKSFRTSTRTTLFATLASLALLAISTAPSRADDDSSQLRFTRGTVEPVRLTIPANTPVKLQVSNAGDAAVEFESFELHRERVVQPGQTITVLIPRLAPGTYQFVDDFSHGATAGEIVAR
jgi:heme/copper-type cytochrome/quinol oxidase subunit 2